MTATTWDSSCEETEMGISLYVSGPRACFSRPEALVERLSYEIITPSAARGLIEAIHWKPVIRWVIDSITVLNPIRWETTRTNEVTQVCRSTTGHIDLGRDTKLSQRSTRLLRDVAYVIDAHAEETGEADERDRAAGINIVQKHEDIFRQRLADGKCVRQPCLGLQDYSARVTPVSGNLEPHASLRGRRDLGMMLLDIAHEPTERALPSRARRSITFRAIMRDGIIDVPQISLP